MESFSGQEVLDIIFRERIEDKDIWVLLNLVLWGKTSEITVLSIKP